MGTCPSQSVIALPSQGGTVVLAERTVPADIFDTTDPRRFDTSRPESSWGNFASAGLKNGEYTLKNLNQDGESSTQTGSICSCVTPAESLGLGNLDLTEIAADYGIDHNAIILNPTGTSDGVMEIMEQ